MSKIKKLIIIVLLTSISLFLFIVSNLVNPGDPAPVDGQRLRLSQIEHIIINSLELFRDDFGHYPKTKFAEPLNNVMESVSSEKTYFEFRRLNELEVSNISYLSDGNRYTCIVTAVDHIRKGKEIEIHIETGEVIYRNWYWDP